MNERVLKRRTWISFGISIAVFVVIFALALMLGRYKIVNHGYKMYINHGEKCTLL